MSLLTKIFIIVVFMVSLVALGVQATLFSQRVDWKHKFVQETHQHWRTAETKDTEIGYLRLEKENRQMFIEALNKRIVSLATENAGLNTKIADLERINSDTQIKLEKTLTDIESFTKQLEVQLVQIKDRELKLADLRDKVGKMVAEKTAAIQELMYVKQELERSVKDLGALEERHVTLVRDKRKLEDMMESLRLAGIDLSKFPPVRPINGKIMSYSSQAGLVIINQGKDAGSTVGMKFTIYRGDKFVATGIVKEAEREWSALTIELKYLDPQIGDDVSNHMLLGAIPPSK